MSYLEIKNLEISFPTPKGKYTAVRDINLSIKKGEIISIIGHSGCGKSTIIKIISGVYQRDGGTIEFDGKKHKIDFIGKDCFLTPLKEKISYK